MAAGDRCLGSYGEGLSRKGTAAACFTSILVYVITWLVCPVSRSHERFKAASGWVGCAATSYLKLLYRDGALHPEVDEDGRALFFVLLSVSASALVCFHLKAQFDAAHMRRYLLLLGSSPHTREELLSGVHQHVQ